MRNSEYMAMMQGDDGTPGTAELVAAYEQGIDDLRAAVAGLTADQVLARPVPGRWSTAECVAHLADTEVFFTDRIVRTIALDRPLLMAADEVLYIGRLDYQGADLGEQLALFAALRRHAARVLRAQPPGGWSRTAVHSGSGLLTLRQLVLQPVRHLRHHLPFLAEKRAALGGERPEPPADARTPGGGDPAAVGPVRLRPVGPGDLPRMYELQLDPESNRLAMVTPRTAEAFGAHWAAALRDPSATARAILVGGAMVGYACCFPRDGRANVGYWIAREHWGKGIASRALELLLLEVASRPLYAHVSTGNAASLRVLEKCGFAVERVHWSPGTDRYPACEEAILVLGPAGGGA